MKRDRSLKAGTVATGTMALGLMGYLLPAGRQAIATVDDDNHSLTMITLDPQPQPPVQISEPGEKVGFVIILPSL